MGMMPGELAAILNPRSVAHKDETSVLKMVGGIAGKSLKDS